MMRGVGVNSHVGERGDGRRVVQRSRERHHEADHRHGEVWEEMHPGLSPGE